MPVGRNRESVHLVQIVTEEGDSPMPEIEQVLGRLPAHLDVVDQHPGHAFDRSADGHHRHPEVAQRDHRFVGERNIQRQQTVDPFGQRPGVQLPAARPPATHRPGTAAGRSPAGSRTSWAPSTTAEKNQRETHGAMTPMALVRPVVSAAADGDGKVPELAGRLLHRLPGGRGHSGQTPECPRHRGRREPRQRRNFDDACGFECWTGHGAFVFRSSAISP